MEQSRRSFLRALGLGAAAGAAAGYVPLFAGGAAATDGFPKRLLFVIHGNGTVQERFWPSGGAGRLDVTTSPLLAPLAPFQDRMVVVRGVTHALWEHGPGRDHVKARMQCLTQLELLGDGEGNRAWPGESIDHAIARSIDARARAAGDPPPPIPLVVATANTTTSSFSATGPGAPLPAQKDPRVLFGELFGSLPAGAEDPGVDPSVERQLAKRDAVFEAVASRLSAIEDRVGVDGRRKTEAHLDAIARVRESLAGLAMRGATCGRPDADFSPLEGGITDTDVPAIVSLHARIIASAFACDLTRVATLVHGSGPIVPSWVGDVPIDEGSPATIHALAHKGTRPDKWGPEFRDTHAALEAWRAQQVLELVEMLDAVPEGEGTMLDNTLVVWTSDMARGNHDIAPPVPLVLIGGAGGALDTGRLVTTDASFLELLTAVGRLVDVDVGPFGDPRFRGDIGAL